MNPTPSQINALKKIEDFIKNQNDIFVLKGGAGTGKTTIIKEILNIIKKNDRTFSISASTGRAATIIPKILNLNSDEIFGASTIHSMIYHYKSLNIIQQTNDEDSDTFNLNFSLKNNDNNINHIYIIDEASMIGNNESKSEFLRFGSGKLLSDLIDYSGCNESNNNRKIIFIGDDAQLPPVDDNQDDFISPALSVNYLKNNFNNLVIEEFSLQEVHRQLQGSLILENSLMIRNQIKENEFNFFDLKYDENSFLNKNDIHELIDAFLKNFQLGEIINPVLITWKNSSVKEYNDIIRKILFKDDFLDLNRNETLMITQNNLMYNVFNGENCIVEKIYNSTESILQPITRVGGGEPLNIKLKFRDVRLRKFNNLSSKEESFDAKIIENTLDSDGPNMHRDTHRALFVYVKNKIIEKTGDKKILKNNPKLFGEMLQKDSYFNAIHVKYGYSITCHKSQGGEYEKVYVDFTPVTNILSEQYFRWSYTALTRGKKKLYSINAPTRYVKTDIFAERNKIRSNQTNEEIGEKDISIAKEISSFDWRIELENAMIHSLGGEYCIESDKSISEFHHRYNIKDKGDEVFTIDIHRKKNGKLTILGPNQDLRDKLNFEYIIIDENLMNINDMSLGQKNIFNNLGEIIEDPIFISKIEHLPYKERYFFKKNYEVAVIEYTYNKQGICTSAKAITDNSLTHSLLK